MKKLSVRTFAAMALFAAFAYPQSQTKAPDENQATASDEATREARRQGRVALKPDAQSPAESMRQAIAFERYKELAAQRQARKEGSVSETSRSADRSVDKPSPMKEKPAKKQ